MYRETTTKNELKELLVHNILQYKNCIVELRQSNNPPLYIIANKLSEGIITISIGTRDKVVGDIIKDNRDEIENVLNYFILDKIPYNFYTMTKVTPICNDNKSIDNNSEYYPLIREKYIENQYNVLNSNPICLKDINDIKKIFKMFLKEDNCTKLIVAISVSIPDLEKDFCISTTCDKMYLCNRDVIAITSIREDTKDSDKKYLHYQSDEFVEFKQNDKNEVANKEFMEHIGFSIKTCKNISDNKIKINVYSNVKLI